MSGAPPPEPPLPPPPFYYSPAQPDVYNPSLAGWGKIDDYFCVGKTGSLSGAFNSRGASCWCKPGGSDSADNSDPILTAAACAALADELNSHAFTFDNTKMCEIFSSDGRKNNQNYLPVRVAPPATATTRTRSRSRTARTTACAGWDSA